MISLDRENRHGLTLLRYTPDAGASAPPEDAIRREHLDAVRSKIEALSEPGRTLVLAAIEGRSVKAAGEAIGLDCNQAYYILRKALAAIGFSGKLRLRPESPGVLEPKSKSSKYRQKNKARGVCTICGRASEPGITLCAYHDQLRRVRSKRSYWRRVLLSGRKHRSLPPDTEREQIILELQIELGLTRHPPKIGTSKTALLGQNTPKALQDTGT